MQMKQVATLFFVCFLFQCGQVPSTSDGGFDSGISDAGAIDSGPVPFDAGSTDAGSTDAGSTDAGFTDGGSIDSGSIDSGSIDAGLMDAGFIDASIQDAGIIDSGLSDASVDAGNQDSGFDAGRFDAGYSDGGTFRLRAMAANLTSGNGQSYPNPGPGQRIVAGLNADVVMLQEFNTPNNSAGEFQNLTEAMLGPGNFYSRGSGQIPNGVLSRWPIVMSGEWIDPEVSNRTFAYAKIDIPGPIDLWAISVHLLTSSATNRNLEAQALLGRVQMNIPSTDFVLLGGDFNTGSRSEQCFFALNPVFSIAGPHPADQSGNQGTNANRDKPYDHVLASINLRPHQIAVQVGANSFAGGLVVDTQVYTPIADIAPALVGDSNASMMQHMGVVKDFLIPQ
jgi:endonuclease/exonuclease/phosphatase family metal-dependent hydrolase